MTESKDLTKNSVLFWLVALIAIGIIFIGVRFLVAPLTAAEAFGVPADAARTVAYLWVKGTRDIVSGLFVILLLWLGVGRRVMAAFIAVAALIPIGDFTTVYLNVGVRNPIALLIHSGTAFFMLILAALLRREA